jgi:hypothetical protein
MITDDSLSQKNASNCRLFRNQQHTSLRRNKEFLMKNAIIFLIALIFGMTACQSDKNGTTNIAPTLYDTLELDGNTIKLMNGTFVWTSMYMSRGTYTTIGDTITFTTKEISLNRGDIWFSKEALKNKGMADVTINYLFTPRTYTINGKKLTFIDG